jgi:hypothetical protein
VRLLDIDAEKRRVHVLGLRVHHGLVGVGAVLVGAILIAHDRADFPWSLK